MFSFGFQKSTDESEMVPFKLYNRKTSQSWEDQDQKSSLWHQEFPNFQFLKELSATESSTVWLVRDKCNNHDYAAKIILKIENQLIQKNHQVEELQFITKIKLIHCVKTFEVQQSNDFYLILMEYLKQGDLASYTQNYEKNLMPKFSQQHLSWVQFYFREIVQCVSELHQAGYVHRDLKPENFLIDNHGHLKLNDFGLIIKQNTVDTKFCGTLSYMAPQRLDIKKSKQPILRSSDMWSLGIILYELLTGTIPYEENDKEQLLQLIYSNFIEFNSQIKESLKNLILQLLQINPSKRLCMTQLKDHPFVKNYYLLFHF